MGAEQQIISTPFCNRPKQKLCSNCGVTFGCGPAGVKSTCWCEDLPHVSQVAAADQDCLCPACLGVAIANLSGPVDLNGNLRGDPSSLPTLVEGEDYYVEGAAIVFTAGHLLRRGYCCDSGCRHCPYEAQKTATSAR